jgi:CubicO group peptidase (beta-lactamase class C family)
MNKGEIDNTRILSTDSVRDMLPAETTDLAIGGFGIGVFWLKIKLGIKGRAVIGHGGSDPGAYTFMQYDPEKLVGVVLLSNGDDDIDGTDKDEWRTRHSTLINKLLEYAEDL